MIKVKDSQGVVYSSDMSLKDDNSILEIHFCTSYTSVEVQYLNEDYDEKTNNKKYLRKWVYTKPDNGEMNAIDEIAFDGNEEWGEFINE